MVELDVPSLELATAAASALDSDAFPPSGEALVDAETLARLELLVFILKRLQKDGKSSLSRFARSNVLTCERVKNWLKR